MEVSLLASRQKKLDLLTYLRDISSIGAIVTVMSLAIDPFVQQVTSYRLENVASPHNSTIPVRITFNESLISAYQGAAYTALYNSGNSALTPDCSSGNCTWARYQTLAVCSRCTNVLDLVQVSPSGCFNHTYSHACHGRLPNGLKLDSTLMMDSTGQLPSMKLDNQGYSIVNFSTIYAEGSDMWAAECSLYWCTNTYTAVMNNARFDETLQSSWYNATHDLIRIFPNQMSFDYDPF